MTNLPTDLDVARFFRSITEGRSVVLFLAKTTEGRLRAYCDRLNEEIVGKGFEPFDPDDLEVLILGLVETGLREHEGAHGLEADRYGDLRTAEEMAEERKRRTAS